MTEEDQKSEFVSYFLKGEATYCVGDCEAQEGEGIVLGRDLQSFSWETYSMIYAEAKWN